MNLSDWLKMRVLNWLGISKPQGDPYSQRMAFLSSDEKVRGDELDVYDAWYSGKSSELLNIYTAKSVFGYADEPIYNRNNQNFFWSVASHESGFKRTHSGFPRDMINAMSAKVGYPSVSSTIPARDAMIKSIARSDSFGQLLVDIALPVAMYEGTGAFKPCFDRRYGSYPFLEFYKERDIQLIMFEKKNIGVVFKDYYKDDDGNDYVLCETRFANYSPELNSGATELDNGFTSFIKYELYKVTKGNAKPVPLSSLEYTRSLPQDPIAIKGMEEPLAVPVVLFGDTTRDGYGVSVYANKIDVFDDIDQAYSEQSMTTRYSTPQEYMNSEYCQRDPNGIPIQPNTFARKYTMLDKPIGNGDASSGDSRAVFDTQPELNVNQYSQEIDELKSEALGSFMSPATMGIGMGSKDNGDSQREKEKVTIATRDKIIAAISPSIKKAFGMLLMLKEYMDKGEMSLPKYDDISVSFNGFSSPTMETKANVLTPMWAAKAISPKSYVNYLWGDSKNADEKKDEESFLQGVLDGKYGAQPNMAKTERNSDKGRSDSESSIGIKPDGQSYAARGKSPMSAESAKKPE